MKLHISFVSLFLLAHVALHAQNITAGDGLLRSFISPPDSAKPRVYWWWLFNRVDSAGIKLDLEEFKAKGISGVNLICTGGYAGKTPLLGVQWLGPKWRDLFRYAVTTANKLHIEIGFNLAGGWTMMGPWVTQDNAMKKVVSATLRVIGPAAFTDTLPRPVTIEGYYHDILVQAFRVKDSTKEIEPGTLIDLTSRLQPDGHLEWSVPPGQWVILRTGWQQSPAFFTYLSRCQYMLQQGTFVGDVCFFLGERPPLLAPPKYDIPTLGPGYDCDYANAEVLLTRMSVRDGRIVLPDGMSYRLLVLQNCTSPSPEIAKEVGAYQQLSVSPVPSRAMSLPVIKRLRDLINNGATVVGAPPEMSAELKDYPQCDMEVRKIAAEIWGDLDGKTRTERRFGKGRVIWGKTPREILLADGVTPDFTYTDQVDSTNQFDYIHRSMGETQIYFVINRTNRRATSDFTFRVAGKQPEIWDAVSGKTRPAHAYHQANGCTTLPLELEAFGSWFIVFRKPVARDAGGQAHRNFPRLTEIAQLNGPWKVTFDTTWGGPATAEFPALISWTSRPEAGIKYYSGKATYRKTFDLNASTTARLFLDLGSVKNLAEVRLNGKNLGILWCAPWRVDITGAVKPADNVLEVDIIDLWANRVIGDLNLPKEKRITKTHDAFRFDMLRATTPLLNAGLLGPVKIYCSNYR